MNSLENIKSVFTDEVKGDKREILTDELIKADLKLFVESRIITALVACIPAAIFIFFGGFFLFSGEALVMLSSVPILAVGIFFLVNAIIFICKAYPRIKALKSPYVIVKDKLVGLDTVDDYMQMIVRGEILGKPRHGNRIFFDMYFSSYGCHTIPTSMEFDHHYLYTNPAAVNLADVGDEFYLVLSQPHSGKILLTYRTERFKREN